MFDDIEPVFLTKDQARQELEFLAKRLAELDDAYYRDDAPLLTDMEYDRLKKRNEQIEALFPDLVLQNTPSKKVGAKPVDGFAKIIHRCLGLKVSVSWACFWAPSWRQPSCRSAPTRCMWLCLWPRTTLSAASSSAPWATGSEASPPIGSGASDVGNGLSGGSR